MKTRNKESALPIFCSYAAIYTPSVFAIKMRVFRFFNDYGLILKGKNVPLPFQNDR
jgi:hypothetical protein